MQIAQALMLIGLNVACILLARLMAMHRARSPRFWMWSAALLGPLPLPLLWALPRKRRHEPA